MAIRDRFRRALRKESSIGTIRHTNTHLTIDSNTSNDSDDTNFSLSLSPNKRASFLTRAFTWGTGRRGSRSARVADRSSDDNSDNNDALGLAQQINIALNRTPSEAEREMKAEKKRQRKAKYQNGGKIHPRDKPLTAQNLRHQAMLGEWSWDSSLNASSSRRSIASGISPCCTRPPSVHGGDDFYGNDSGSDQSSQSRE